MTGARGGRGQEENEVGGARGGRGQEENEVNRARGGRGQEENEVGVTRGQGVAVLLPLGSSAVLLPLRRKWLLRAAVVPGRGSEYRGRLLRLMRLWPGEE